MQGARFFTSQVNEGSNDEVLQALDEIKDEKGKTLQELGMLHSLNIKPKEGLVQVKLNLTTDYRKVKSLIQDKLQSRLHWATKIEISMAPAA